MDGTHTSRAIWFFLLHGQIELRTYPRECPTLTYPHEIPPVAHSMMCSMSRTSFKVARQLAMSLCRGVIVDNA